MFSRSAPHLLCFSVIACEQNYSTHFYTDTQMENIGVKRRVIQNALHRYLWLLSFRFFA